jgi:hypothetical protein
MMQLIIQAQTLFSLALQNYDRTTSVDSLDIFFQKYGFWKVELGLIFSGKKT